MHDVIRIETSNPSASTLPAIRIEQDVRVRAATQGDFAFIDGLQKAHSKALGFQYEQAIRKRIDNGEVLVAEQDETADERGYTRIGPGADSGVGVHPRASAVPDSGRLLGYVMGTDRYLKRDELGIIYQLAVAPGTRRRLIGAHLLKAMFERSAYGCRLYCCWCAQDLAANEFWEAMGFVPLAFRTGGGRNSKAGPRIHIFWQKRIRANDKTTDYWFPSQTGAGSIGEDRIVLPIPPGTSWQDAKPVVLPEGSKQRADEIRMLEDEVAKLEAASKTLKGRKKAGGKAKPTVSVVVPRQAVAEAGGLHFGAPPEPPETQEASQAPGKKQAEAERQRIEAELKEAKRAVKRASKKFDPKQEAFARELKDRWLEAVVAQPDLLAAERSKYDVRRQVEAFPGAGTGAGAFPGAGAGDEGGEGMRRLVA